MKHRNVVLTALFLALIAPVLFHAIGCGGGDGGGGEENQLVVRDVAPGAGIDAYQMSFWNPQASFDDTSWGRLWVDPAELEKTTGIRRGWLNVATEQGWVVANLPVPPAEEGPFAVYFDLGLAEPAPLQQVDLHLKHSNQAFSRIADHMREAVPFPLDAFVVNAGGFGPEAEIDPGPPPYVLASIAELVAALQVTQWTQQLTNEQCAQDQCATMATANAFQYLEDMGVWTVPHVHGMGLGGDTTLVGQLDTATGRFCPSRPVGNGIGSHDVIDGSFEYVSDNGLTGVLNYRHQDQGWGSALPAANYTAHGSTSQYDGAMPTWNWLRDRIRDGCGVVAGYSHASGGHMVRVTGVKIDSSNNRWMRYTHDRLQTGSDPTDTQGLETVWVQLSDLDGDGILNLGAVSRELRVLWASCP